MDTPQEQLRFPLTWHGSLIVFRTAGDVSPLIQEVFSRLKLTESTFAPGKSSSAGTYAVWKLSAVVQDYETLLALFASLEQLPGVKMLI